LKTFLLSVSLAQIAGTFVFSNAVNQVAIGSVFIGGGQTGKIKLIKLK
jgi:hypothetical protein